MTRESCQGRPGVCIHLWRSSPGWASAFVVCLVLMMGSSTASAQATRGEGFVGGGPALVFGDAGGGGASLQGGWGVSNSWGLLYHGSVVALPQESAPFSVQSRQEVGAFANLDVLSVVPWVGAVAGLEYTVAEETAHLRPAGSLLAGVEYRPLRQWSGGLWVQLRTALDGGRLKEQGVGAGIRIAWRFRPGWDF